MQLPQVSFISLVVNKVPSISTSLVCSEENDRSAKSTHEGAGCISSIALARSYSSLQSGKGAYI